MNTCSWIIVVDERRAGGMLETARKLGGDVVAAVVGPRSLADAVAGLGFDRVLSFETQEDFPVEAYAGQVAEAAKAAAPNFMMASDAPAGRMLLGAVAATLNASLIGAVRALCTEEDGIVASKSIAEGKLWEDVKAQVGGIPWVFEQVAIGQADFTGLFVNLVDLDLYLLAFFDDVAGMLDTVPAQLADVDQTIEPTQINERTKIANATDDAFENIASLNLFELFLTFRFTLTLQDRPPADDEITASHVGLVDQTHHLLIDEFRQIFDAVFGDLADGHERADRSDLTLQSTSVVTGHECFDDRPLVDIVPVTDFDCRSGQGARIQSVFTAKTSDEHLDGRAWRRFGFRELFEWHGALIRTT